MVMFERHTSVNGEAVEVVEFVDPRHDMVLDGFGERHVVGRENQFHKRMMVSTGQKIQSKRLADFPRGSPRHKPTMLREEAAQRPRQFILQRLQLAIEG